MAMVLVSPPVKIARICCDVESHGVAIAVSGSKKTALMAISIKIFPSRFGGLYFIGIVSRFHII